MTQPGRSVITKRAAKASLAVALSTLSIRDLIVFHAAAQAAADAWMSIANQPRAQGDRIQTLLDDEWDRANGLLAVVFDELRARRPVEQEEAKARAQCLLGKAGDYFRWDEAAQILFSVTNTSRRQAQRWAIPIVTTEET